MVLMIGQLGLPNFLKNFIIRFVRIQLSQKNYLLSEELTLLKQNNTDLSQAVNEFTLLLDNSMITEANLTTTKTFSHNKIIVSIKSIN